MGRHSKVDPSVLVPLLGTDTDAAIAKKLGLSAATVFQYRRMRSIPVFVNTREWTDEQIAMLGKEPDSVVAKKIGCATYTVAEKRATLGIEKCINKAKWPQEWLALLGTASDANIGKKLGLGYSTVRSMRQSKGIPSHQLAKTLKLKQSTPKPDAWPKIKPLPQGELFAALRELHNSANPVGEKFTHKHLSELTGCSLSRIQKWMTPGTAQEPLSLSTRHHLFLSVLHGHHI